MRVSRTIDNKKEKYLQQIDFLKASCFSYDIGNITEAIRISNALMMLINHSRNNKSLLTQASLEIDAYVDTSKALSSTKYVSSPEFLLTHFEMFTGKFVPTYNDNPSPKMVSFEDWWNMPILYNADHSAKLSRKEVVKYMRDQDGGAHSDPELDEIYAKFSLENATRISISKPGREIDIYAPTNPDDWIEVSCLELATVRQIAHEFLSSINDQIEIVDKRSPIMPVRISLTGKPTQE